MQHPTLLARRTLPRGWRSKISTFCRRLRQLIISIHIDLSVWTVNTSHSLPPPPPGPAGKPQSAFSTWSGTARRPCAPPLPLLVQNSAVGRATDSHSSIPLVALVRWSDSRINYSSPLRLTASVLKGTATTTAPELHRHFTKLQRRSVDLSRSHLLILIIREYC